MHEDFLSLYKEWKKSYAISAYGSSDPAAKEPYEKLRRWCLDNKEEAIESIKEILIEGPDDVVQLLPELTGITIEIEWFIGIVAYCNLWLNIINKDISLDKDVDFSKEAKDWDIKNYYKDWTEWHEYLKDNYISWGGIGNEHDPNVTLEEFKQGKRNDPELIKKNRDYEKKIN